MSMFPKPSKKKNTRPPKQKDHMNWVASQGCMICNGVACVHHIRISGDTRDDMKTIPLCWDHHQGPNGIHFLGKHVWREEYGHELDMLDDLLIRKAQFEAGNIIVKV